MSRVLSHKAIRQTKTPTAIRQRATLRSTQVLEMRANAIAGTSTVTTNASSACSAPSTYSKYVSQINRQEYTSQKAINHPSGALSEVRRAPIHKAARARTTTKILNGTRGTIIGYSHIGRDQRCNGISRDCKRCSPRRQVEKPGGGSTCHARKRAWHGTFHVCMVLASWAFRHADRPPSDFHRSSTIAWRRLLASLHRSARAGLRSRSSFVPTEALHVRN